MTTQETILEGLKVVATIAVPYIALLRTRADLDRFAARQRAKESGGTMESQLRRRWYQRLFKSKELNHRYTISLEKAKAPTGAAESTAVVESAPGEKP